VSEVLRYEHAERVRDFYREQGAEREQARIIELLQKIVDTPPAEWEAPFRGMTAESLIALIKGEN